MNKIIKLTALSIGTLAIMSCGGGGGGDGSGEAVPTGPNATPTTTTTTTTAQSTGKDLFSVWNLANSSEGEIDLSQLGDLSDIPLDVEVTTLDLRDGEFSAAVTVSYSISSLGTCACEFTINGTQDSGTYTINNCIYSPGAIQIDPGCNSLNQTGTFSKTESTLTFMTAQGQSVIYQ